ncbi:MAG: serine/threonine-protein kinase HipA [Bradymonadia bacterium]|jgi:serine/threonine-protein kinase HipA
MTSARVNLWGTTVGAVMWVPDRELGVFQFQPDFLTSGIQLSPLMMPLAEFPYEFPALPRNTFKGLPGLLADSLPDKYGNAVIDAWLAEQGRTAASFHSVERLCYLGSRGMGALEFEPQTIGPPSRAGVVEVDALVALANRVLDERSEVGGAFRGSVVPMTERRSKTSSVWAAPPVVLAQKRFSRGIPKRTNSVRVRSRLPTASRIGA